MTYLESLTFSRPSSDVGLHFRAIRECFGPDAIVIGDAISQVFDLHPQGSAALHIYCHYLTDTWSARRGVCTGNTKTLDAAFYKRHIAKLFLHLNRHIQTNSQRVRRQRRRTRRERLAYLCIYITEKVYYPAAF